MTGQTLRLAESAADTNPAEVPADARVRPMQCLLDFLGVAAAGAEHAESSAVFQATARTDGTGVSRTARVEQPSGEPGTSLFWESVRTLLRDLRTPLAQIPREKP